MGSISYDFDGETVLITGASSGIGRELAFKFAEAEATVLNASRRPESKDEGAELPTHEQIVEDGGQADFLQTDASRPEQLEDAVEDAHAYGGVDIFVNNAGIHITESVLDVTEEQFDRIHETNVKGYFFGCQAAARDMISRGVEGTILNMASISSTMAKPEQIIYESTKGAIQMITRSSALELAEHGIRVNGLAPGRITTEFGEMSAEDKARSVQEGELLKPIPLNRAGTPDDVTGATLFLASDESEYITGEMFYVDGGYQVI